MARMILRAVHSAGERRRWPLSERIVDENLGGYRHVTRQHERFGCATADAEAPRSRSPELAGTHHYDDPGHASRGEPSARRKRPRANGADHDEQLADSARQ